MVTMTHHAQVRLQQRGISHDVVENLLDFGREEHDHRGGCILYFDRQAREKLRRTSGAQSFKRMESHLGTYAFLADSGEIITVGHRTRRINHT